ncbi:MAG: alpha-L-fucosidase, partial [Clostridia bacterium]|nr:alpha-L-fucosidase [Clostridia bacterium]
MLKLFEASFESLYNFKAPEWYRDAKFGIWSHWGPQSVPMFGDWYARKMYQEGTPAYEHHLRLYGHPSVFGYKDICALWKAEKFDPDELIDLYIDSGAKFFAAQTTHHDNFFNYDSAVNPMNSVNVGPHKDICAMWERAA